MRLYGKKFVKNKMRDIAEIHSETRDGILWSIDDSTRTCGVKIQGSDEIITAKFPSNWAWSPFWMKIGNAVRIVHRGGVRGRVEIVSDGQVIPTAIPGGSQVPPTTPGEDGVLTGCLVVAIP